MDKKIIIKLTTGNEITLTDAKVIETVRFARYGLEYNQAKIHVIIPYPSIEIMHRIMK